MGPLFLYVLGAFVVIIGTVLLFISKSETETSLKIRDWIGVKTNSSGIILIILGLCSIAFGVNNDNKTGEPNVLSQTDKKPVEQTPTTITPTSDDASIQSQDPNTVESQPASEKVRNPTHQNSGLSVTVQNDSLSKIWATVRSFHITSNAPTVLIRYRYKNIDTAYAIPVDYSFAELKRAILKHFYSDEILQSNPVDVSYDIFLNHKQMDQERTLLKSDAKTNDRITIRKSTAIRG
ncbi:MAG: hypothetical protein EOP04_02200 [Proteobacteria bacterium]|nr:MAG: hypothetical protein EOP04_02200 [Pseudomonadota bacterium]